MREKGSSVSNKEEQASGIPSSMSSVSQPQAYLQFPEPAAVSYVRKDRSPISSLQPSSARVIAHEDNQTCLFSEGAPVSARSSRASSGRHGSNTASQHSDRLDSSGNHTLDRRRSTCQDAYVQTRQSSTYDTEKGTNTQNAASSTNHQSHAFSTYISEEEEDVKDHTVWILVS